VQEYTLVVIVALIARLDEMSRNVIWYRRTLFNCFVAVEQLGGKVGQKVASLP
jgi:hypothetical protein